MKRKKKVHDVQVDLRPDEVPLEVLVELIEAGGIQEEIPFDFLAEHYSELLDEWYPGFPGAPRKMSKEDPVRCRGRVHNGFLELIDIPGAEKIALGGELYLSEKEHDLFLKQDGDGGWFIYLASGAEEDEEKLCSLNLIQN